MAQKGVQNTTAAQEGKMRVGRGILLILNVRKMLWVNLNLKFFNLDHKGPNFEL